MNFIESHHWFVRKSQHYLNGNWHCYQPFTFKQKIYYPIAYTKFMYYVLLDKMRGKAKEPHKPEDIDNEYRKV